MSDAHDVSFAVGAACVATCSGGARGIPSPFRVGAMAVELERRPRSRGESALGCGSIRRGRVRARRAGAARRGRCARARKVQWTSTRWSSAAGRRATSGTATGPTCCRSGWPTWTCPRRRRSSPRSRRGPRTASTATRSRPTRWSRPCAVHLLAAHGWAVAPDALVYLPGVVPALNLACRAYAAPGEAVLTVVPAYPPFLEAPGQQGRQLVDRARAPARAGAGSCRSPSSRRPSRRARGSCCSATRTTLWGASGAPTTWPPWSTSAAATASCSSPTRSTATCCSSPVRHVPSVVVAPDAAELTVTLMAPSKTFNLPGLNFAFAVIPDEALRQRFAAAGAGLLPFPGCFAIAAAEAAYRDGGEWLAELLGYLRGNADLVERFVDERAALRTTSRVEATYLAWLDARAWLEAHGAPAPRRPRPVCGPAWRCPTAPPSAPPPAFCASTSAAPRHARGGPAAPEGRSRLVIRLLGRRGGEPVAAWRLPGVTPT